MGRILDTDKYPKKTNPSLDDYVIGTNSEAENKETRNFKIADILALGGGGGEGDSIFEVVEETIQPKEENQDKNFLIGADSPDPEAEQTLFFDRDNEGSFRHGNYADNQHKSSYAQAPDNFENEACSIQSERVTLMVTDVDMESVHESRDTCVAYAYQKDTTPGGHDSETVWGLYFPENRIATINASFNILIQGAENHEGDLITKTYTFYGNILFTAYRADDGVFYFLDNLVEETREIETMHYGNIIYPAGSSIYLLGSGLEASNMGDIKVIPVYDPVNVVSDSLAVPTGTNCIPLAFVWQWKSEEHLSDVKIRGVVTCDISLVKSEYDLTEHIISGHPR